MSVRRRLERHHGWAALALFTVGALVAQQHAVAHLASSVSGNGIGDPTQFMWAMWWWPHAILTGTNPFVTHAIWVGDPFNLGSVTSTPLPALAASPITALFGPVVSYNVMNLVAQISGAWFAYRTCLYVTGAPAAAIAGGWLYGFSTYEIGQLAGHLQLVFTFAPPALVLLILQRFDERITARRFAVLATLVLTAELLCGTEVVFTMTVVAAVGFVAALALAPDRGRVLRLIPPLAIAYVMTAVICSPLLYYALTGPEVGAGQGVAYPADLVSFLIPSPITWAGGNAFRSVSSGYVAGITEAGAYLGAALIAIVVAYAFESGRQWRARVLLITTAGAAVLSLGERLNVDGHSTISLPWKLVSGIKGFDEVLPVRLSMFTALGCAMAAALWLARPQAARWGRWLLAATAVLLLLPNPNAVGGNGDQPVFNVHYENLSFFTQGTYRRYLRRDEVVLPIPFGYLGSSLLWQAQAHGYFRLASGWFGYWPPDYYSDPVVMQMIGAQPFTTPVSGMRAFLARHHVGAVVMQADQTAQWPQVMAKLGLSSVAVGGVLVYDVPPTLR